MAQVPTVDLVKTGNKLTTLRTAAGLTAKDLADTLGVSAQAVSKWQKGLTLPTVDNLVVLAALLHVKVDDLLVVA